jgi:hypothetical protein
VLAVPAVASRTTSAIVQRFAVLDGIAAKSHDTRGVEQNPGIDRFQLAARMEANV